MESLSPVYEIAEAFGENTSRALFLTGKAGTGKTTFLKLLMDEYPYQGSITASVAFDYFPCPVPHPDWLAGEALEEVCPEVPRWRLLREMAALQLDE